ncbi:esterase-like activity of phytase family protein [Rhizobiaceae bacterium n13]|uniref:Esterase-like activity of phytase family protein n=1 Tax=Ferirhizobium litorale TaxID=2927786 RepID=A0AAE3U4N0_9HYPH|nr:esterase-like activity of phytase family protein [Fererhizobium litorale]MDI7862588.1 esterase-like activity of phytase family protein [Fererhizobium litorale]MDI7923578.1 esterase-like activity of phytase family protein [Fererhizobium litorale]
MLFSASVFPFAGVAGETFAVDSRQISNFKVTSEQSTFGSLEFVGGLVMNSDNAQFGALSSIRFRPDGRHFVGVLDTGHWMTGAIERDSEGRLLGLSSVEISPMVGEGGSTEKTKWLVDAEGLALRDGEIVVGFEQRHRVDVYPDAGFETSPPLRSVPFLIPAGELRRNGGFETVVVAPTSSPLAGAVLVVAERSVDPDGNFLAAILEGPLKGRFTLKRRDRYDATDAAFLPNGDLLLLERRFELSTGIGMRIRRIKGSSIRPGAVVDGEVLLEAGFGAQIDNMEGLDVVVGTDGTPHIIITSDDNHSILERSLMLEFRLNEVDAKSTTN